MNPACDEKARLLKAYQTASLEHSRSVTALSNRSGTTSRNEYQRLMLASEECLLIAQHARLEIDKHAREHGC